MVARVARVYPSGFSSMLAIVMGALFIAIGLAMLVNGIVFGLVFMLFSGGMVVYHVANLRGHAVPHFEEAVLPSDGETGETDRLETLEAWHREGLVSDREYEAKRKEILDRL